MIFDGIKAVIFDLDGTLADSMWMWGQIDIEYLGRFGLTPPADMEREIEGMGFTETAEYFKRRFDLPDTIEQIKADWLEMSAHKYAHEVPLKPGAHRLLRQLRANGLRIGIASSNSRELIEACLKSNHCLEYFDAIVTSCDVAAGKPAPDVYLCAAQLLDTDPEFCLVFEDVLAGIRSGKSAGMRVCSVYDRWSDDQPALKKQLADASIDTFEEILDELRFTEVTDLENPELDVYARMSEVQLLNRANPEQGMFIAESPKVIERALEGGCVPLSFLTEPRHIQGEGKAVLMRCPGVPVFTAEPEILSGLTGYPMTRGMLSVMRRPKPADPAEICKDARRIAVLENVVNPTNIGAIFRSAAALNIDAVLLTRGCSNPLYRRAIRVSMGTVFQIPWAFFDESCFWPEDGIRMLNELGFRTAAMALRSDSVRIDDERLMQVEKLALILGTEGDGLSASTIADCDYTVRIPMTHGVDSLNVAAASAVAFWQIANR